MNKSTLILVMFFILFRENVSNTFMNNAEFVIIDIKYDTTNSSIPIKSYGSDQNQFKISQNEVNVIGAPLLVDSSPELTSTSLLNLFRLNQNGFSLFFNIFSNDQKLAIAKRIMSEYRVNISTPQIITFKLSELKCTTTIYCDNKPVEIEGKAHSLSDYPIEVKFYAKKSTRTCLEQYLFGIMLVRCSYVQNVKRDINSKFVSAFQLRKIDLADLLFGTYNEIFMTRKQLDELANDICSHYCPDYRHKQSIVNLNDFIHENRVELKQLDFGDAFNSLSRYISKMKLNAVEIKSMYECVLKVKVYKWKKYIGINNQINRTLLASFGIEESYNYVSGNEETWSESEKSLDEQIKELNSFSRNDVEWRIEGDKILPKRLNLTKFFKSCLQNGLKFKLFERVSGEAVVAMSLEIKDGKL